jgi:hypothetical protein
MQLRVIVSMMKPIIWIGLRPHESIRRNETQYPGMSWRGGERSQRRRLARDDNATYSGDGENDVSNREVAEGVVTDLLEGTRGDGSVSDGLSARDSEVSVSRARKWDEHPR